MPFGAIVGGLVAGAAGGLFGSKKKDKIKTPQLSAMGKEAQSTLYADVTRALQGRGLLDPGLQDRLNNDLLASYETGYGEAQSEMDSNLARLIPKADTGVREYAKNLLSSSYYDTVRNVRQDMELQPYQDQQQAMGMATDLLAGEKQMGAQITDIYNQQIARNEQIENQYGTFGSNLAFGLGSAGGWMTAAQRYGQAMSEKGGMA